MRWFDFHLEEAERWIESSQHKDLESALKKATEMARLRRRAIDVHWTDYGAREERYVTVHPPTDMRRKQSEPAPI